MKQTNIKTVTEIYDAQKQLFDINYSHWIDTVLFSFNWWFLIVIALIPWWLWWKYVDRSRLLEILFLGILVMIIALILDSIGVSFLFWTYKYKVIQMIPPLNPIDITVLPILYMLIYQYFSKWIPFILAHVLLALLGAFFAEPLFTFMDIYKLHTWEYYYSIPIYIAIGIFTKLITIKVANYQKSKLVNK